MTTPTVRLIEGGRFVAVRPTERMWLGDNRWHERAAAWRVYTAQQAREMGLIRRRCGWCGGYEDELPDPDSACPQATDHDSETGEPYICGPHQYVTTTEGGAVWRLRRPL